MPSGVIKTWMDIVLALVSPWDPGSCPVTLGTRAYICLYFVGFGTQGTALFYLYFSTAAYEASKIVEWFVELRKSWSNFKTLLCLNLTFCLQVIFWNMFSSENLKNNRLETALCLDSKQLDNK